VGAGRHFAATRSFAAPLGATGRGGCTASGEKGDEWMTIQRRFPMVVVVALCGLAAGCGDDEVEPPPQTGFLTLEWSIEGLAEPAACDRVNARAMEIAVFYPDGFFLTEVEAPCSAFQQSIELFPGEYVIFARLVDSEDLPITTRKRLDVDLSAGEDQGFDLEFGPDQIL
jgi:hypothetical protein